MPMPRNTSYTIVNPNDANQAPSTVVQNYDIDINKLYTDFIVEIDKIRSHVSVQNNPSLQNITNISSNTNPTNIKQEQTPQESRCHAFYRLLGLPVSDGTTLYSPGFDQPNNNNASINNAKIAIAKNLLNNKPLVSLIDYRENQAREYLSYFADQGLDASILAMSLGEVRQFSAPLKNLTGPFDSSINHQIYSSSLLQRLIQNVVNTDGSKTVYLDSNRIHILSPFIVDPRIDFNVFPKRSTIAVPFLQDKTQTRLTDDVYLPRPYIEKVCRDRFDSSDKTTSYGTSITNILGNIKSTNYYQSSSLLQSAFGNISNITDETVQFANYINAIQSSLKQLYQAVSSVRMVLAADPTNNGAAKYNWTPIPSTSGPEQSSTTRDLYTQQPNDPNNTQLDQNIIANLFQQSLNNISNKLTSLQAANIGGFAFDGIELTPDQNSTDALGDTYVAPIDSQMNERASLTDAANTGIQNIERLVGEFSGIGLIDIFVISAAFWTLDKSSLISLLDSTAINRMLTNANLQDPIVQSAQNGAPVNAATAIANFQSQVLQIYQVVDQMWLDIQINNS
jgi:hypothetical protein